MCPRGSRKAQETGGRQTNSAGTGPSRQSPPHAYLGKRVGSSIQKLTSTRPSQAAVGNDNPSPWDHGGRRRPITVSACRAAPAFAFYGTTSPHAMRTDRERALRRTRGGRRGFQRLQPLVISHVRPGEWILETGSSDNYARVPGKLVGRAREDARASGRALAPPEKRSREPEARSTKPVQPRRDAWNPARTRSIRSARPST
jgi:hypothetical protein